MLENTLINRAAFLLNVNTFVNLRSTDTPTGVPTARAPIIGNNILKKKKKKKGKLKNDNGGIFQDVAFSPRYVIRVTHGSYGYCVNAHVAIIIVIYHPHESHCVEFMRNNGKRRT